MEGATALARQMHGGTNVYKSLPDCLRVLRAVEALRLSWWTPDCSAFLSSAATLPAYMPQSTTAAPARHAIVVVEGLDGTGKTRTTRSLAKRLGGIALSTPPPQFAAIREVFRHEDEAVARAFYGAANYIAAAEMVRQARTSTVVVDRWWCSTCAMALANRCTVATLPPAGDAVYAWPTDLTRPDAGFVLSVEESVRVGRIRKRAPEDAEERRLSAQSEMRRTAMEAYARTGMLTVVPAPTYRAAVNTILAAMTQKGIVHNAVPYSAEELRSIDPF